MKLYSLYTPSHEILKDQYFLPSVQDPFELMIERYDYEGTGNYKGETWMRVMRRKVDMVLQAIEDNWGQIFLYSDVDVMFFGRTEEALAEGLGDFDMAFQRDSQDGKMCPGFFVCRANEESRIMWREIRELMKKYPDKHDQDVLNWLWVDRARFFSKAAWNFLHGLPRYPQIKQRVFGWKTQIKPRLKTSIPVHWRYLPDSFYSYGLSQHRNWKPGIPIHVPPHMLAFHANWTTTVRDKVALLEEVKKQRDRD